MTTPTLFDDYADDVDPVVPDPVRSNTDQVDQVRARVCHPSGTPRQHPQIPDMPGEELRDAVKALSHQDLVSLVMGLCSGMYPRIARDSVIAELKWTADRDAP